MTLKQLLDHLGLRAKLTLVLHDWGGMIGMAIRRPAPGADQADRRIEHRRVPAASVEAPAAGRSGLAATPGSGRGSS